MTTDLDLSQEAKEIKNDKKQILTSFSSFSSFLDLDFPFLSQSYTSSLEGENVKLENSEGSKSTASSILSTSEQSLISSLSFQVFPKAPQLELRSPFLFNAPLTRKIQLIVENKDKLVDIFLPAIHYLDENGDPLVLRLEKLRHPTKPNSSQTRCDQLVDLKVLRSELVQDYNDTLDVFSRIEIKTYVSKAPNELEDLKKFKKMMLKFHQVIRWVSEFSQQTQQNCQETNVWNSLFSVYETIVRAQKMEEVRDAEETKGKYQPKKIWSWQDESGIWCEYTKKVCRAFEICQRNGLFGLIECQNTNNIKVKNEKSAVYEIDLKSCLQVNLDTKTRRKIRTEVLSFDSSFFSSPSRSLSFPIWKYFKYGTWNDYYPQVSQQLEKQWQKRKKIFLCPYSFPDPENNKKETVKRFYTLINLKKWRRKELGYLLPDELKNVIDLMSSNESKLWTMRGHESPIMRTQQKRKESSLHSCATQNKRQNFQDSAETEAVLNSNLFPKLVSSTNRYKNIERSFYETCSQSKHQIKCIRKIENKALVCSTLGLLNNFRMRLSPSEVKGKWLWHGTDLETILKIQKEGFNRDFSKVGKFGKGVYFAVKASLATFYAKPTQANLRYLLYCKVLTGASHLGKETDLYPVFKPGTREAYDSRVDDLEQPSIYVACRDFQAVPSFLVVYKTF